MLPRGREVATVVLKVSDSIHLTEVRLGARLARPVELLLLEPGYFVMERGMLYGIQAAR